MFPETNILTRSFSVFSQKNVELASCVSLYSDRETSRLNNIGVRGISGELGRDSVLLIFAATLLHIDAVSEFWNA